MNNNDLVQQILLRSVQIVCTPDEAYRCFMRTEMDWLVIGDFVFDKKMQPAWKETTEWQHEFVPD